MDRTAQDNVAHRERERERKGQKCRLRFSAPSNFFIVVLPQMKRQLQSEREGKREVEG